MTDPEDLTWEWPTNDDGAPVVAFIKEDGEQKPLTQADIDMRLSQAMSDQRRAKLLRDIAKGRVSEATWRARVKRRTDVTRFSEDRKRLFLHFLEDHGKISIAARAAGVSSGVINYHRKKDKEFDDATTLVLEEYSAGIAQIIEKQAVEGFLEITSRKDGEGSEVIKEVRRFETRLRERVLVKHDPSYVERKHEEHEFKGGVLLMPGTTDQLTWAEQYKVFREEQHVKELAERNIVDAEFSLPVKEERHSHETIGTKEDNARTTEEEAEPDRSEGSEGASGPSGSWEP